MTKKLVLLGTTGSPMLDGEDSVRDYLKNFLGDKNIVKTNRFIWYFILNFIILKKRPAYILRKYQEVAIDDEGPLDYYTKRLCHKLNQLDSSYEFKYFYTYCPPFAEDVLDKTDLSQYDELIVLPLYPHYSECTHKTIFTQVDKYLKSVKSKIKVKHINSFATHDLYIEATANKIKEQLSADSYFIFSCHSIPLEYVQAGDPYRDECEACFKKLQDKLGLNDSNSKLCYHSKFGKGEWLEPLFEDKLESLPTEHGIKKLTVQAGFAIDCLETLYDLDKDGRSIFIGSKGDDYKFVPCLNDSEAQIALIMDLVTKA